MSTLIKAKRSSVQGKVPLTTDLELGEFAINTFDGKLFIKKNVNGTESIIDITAAAVPTLDSVVIGGNTTTNSITVGGLTVNGDITVTGTVDGRDVSVDGTKLDGIESGATGDQTATEILTAIKTVDGSGSGLDSDLLDGQDGSYYLDWTNATNKPDPVITLAGDLSGSVTLTDLASGTLTATIVADSVALGTDTTGNYVASITNGSYITGGNGGSEGAALTLAVDAATTATASKVVARDASGNFSANTITAALTGNATTATTLQTSRTIGGVSFDGSANINLPGVNTTGNQNTTGSAATLTTARTISLGGDLSGSASFNGSTNITITATVQPDSVALGTDTTGNYVSSVTGGTGVTITGTIGEGWSPTISIGQNVATTSNVEFHDLILSGNLTINGTTTTINATELAISDNIIYLNDGLAVANPDLGIVGNYNDGTTYAHTGVFRDATDDRWKFFKGYTPEPGQTIDTAHASFQYADVQANTFYGALSGNATTATTLQTARTIAISGDITGTATSFNGGADITISSAITAGAIVNADINASAAIADTKLATISTVGKVLNSATTATNLNTASAIVARDASGNFTAGTITAALTGAASSNVLKAGDTMTGKLNTAGNDSARLIESLNTSASSAIQFYVEHNLATTNVGNARGVLNLVSTGALTIGGSVALTASNYSTYASPLAGSSSLTTTGTVTSGTWSGSFGAVSGANLTSLTAGNLTGTIPSAVLGNSTHYIGTTAIALNRASGSQTLTGVSIDGNAATVTNGALTTGTLAQFAATTSSQLAGVISDETGSGALVFGTSPSFTTGINAASATMALFDTTATTVDAFGAATSLNLGYDGTASSSTTNISGGAAASAVTKTINIGINGASGSITNINIGSATAGAVGNTVVNSTSLIVPGNMSVGSNILATTGPILTLGTLAGGGSGYMDGTHTNQGLTGGTGAYMLGTVTVALGVVTAITLTWGGHRYSAGDVLTVPSLSTTLATTAASGSGTTVTLTFAAQAAAPFQVGSQIIVAGVTPTGYNGTFTVTACTTTTVSYANATTGAQTVAGTVKMGAALTNSTIPVATVQGTDVYVSSWTSDSIGARIRLEANDTSISAGQEYGAIAFSSRDATVNGSGDLALIRGVAVNTSGGGEIQFWTAGNGEAPNISATITSGGNFRLYNAAGTFYSELANSPTANRTISFPDSTFTVAGTNIAQTFTAVQTHSANIIPSTTAAYDLGTTALRWNVMYGTATAARYADLAEKYLADDEYPVGTVMSVGGEAEVTAATPETAHSIVGVVSEKPAYLMNDCLEGGTAIALRGRVPVRVVGVVKKGDRLTVSTTPGCAVSDNNAVRSFAIALHDSNKTEIVEAIIL